MSRDREKIHAQRPHVDPCRAYRFPRVEELERNLTQLGLTVVRTAPSIAAPASMLLTAMRARESVVGRALNGDPG